MDRRQALGSLGAMLLSGAAAHAAPTNGPRRRILFFSRSALFEHTVVRREGGQLSLAERQLTALAARAGLDVDCVKDGGVFEHDLDRYAAVVSYSCGRPADLMKPDAKDGSQPLTERGWKKLDAAVRAGKPFVAIHPGIWLLTEALGADCLGHGSQQAARIKVVSRQFPGVERLGPEFALLEEWFSLIRFAEDLHVILVQDCAGMKMEQPADRRCYARPPFPATWARLYGQGRVFYTSLGHREDVWTSSLFEQLVLGGLKWALGDVEAQIPANLEQVAAEANAFPKS